MNRKLLFSLKRGDLNRRIKSKVLFIARFTLRKQGAFQPTDWRWEWWWGWQNNELRVHETTKEL
jgi:hypothetical protein